MKIISKKLLYCLFVITFSISGLFGQAYHDVLSIGPFPTDVSYFYIDTKIPFTDFPAPQIHITGYGYDASNKAIKLTLSWYVYANNFLFTQYRCDLGYYNPSGIRLGTYDDAGTRRIRIEIANDNIYWSSYFCSATDIRGNPSNYSGWTYHVGRMPAGTGSLTEVREFGQVRVGNANNVSTFTVAGDIRAREVKVEATAGADFVFSNDYRLRSLSEVEAFITENKHLPDIAPADSMAQHGMNMGEFQIKLLQKIEELTLYIIEQDKKNSILERQIKELEAFRKTVEMQKE